MTVQDIRHAPRQLRNGPGVARAFIPAQTFGMSSRAATFGFLDAVLSKPLAHPNPTALRFGIRSGELAMLISVSAGLAISLLRAGYLPARSAAEVGPMVGLRQG
jgi:hypothetical protein